MVAVLAGLVAGAMSKAAGEHVSIISQADTETADISRETAELTTDPAGKPAGLASIRQGRGLSAPIALRVAPEMMLGNALAASKRDELGITEEMAANPIQAGLVSVATFASGAALPLMVAAVLPKVELLTGVSTATTLAFVALGAIGALIGAGRPRGAGQRGSRFGECWRCWPRQEWDGCSAPPARLVR